jgi:hypothetical protein
MTFSESNSPMTPHQQRNLSAIAKRMAGDMKIRNFAQATIDAYTYHVSRFERYIGERGENLETASPEEVREFQLFLIEDRKVGWSSFILSDMMHLSRNLLWGKDLADLDHRLADDWRRFSAPLLLVSL